MTTNPAYFRARLHKISCNPHTRICYADAMTANGAIISGMGFASDGDPTGKYDAMWDLAKVLTRLKVELEATI